MSFFTGCSRVVARPRKQPIRVLSIAFLAYLCLGLHAEIASAKDRLVEHFPEAAKSGCMQCHGEIEPIREIGSEMLEQIMSRGTELGDPAGCVVCHNGDPTERSDKSLAHGGENFYADPGSPWINATTCKNIANTWSD